MARSGETVSAKHDNARCVWLLSQIFPNRVRGLAVSVSVSALSVACFALTFTFPVLNAALGSAGTFWAYAGICSGGR